jgi:hypothetical protein
MDSADLRDALLKEWEGWRVQSLPAGTRATVAEAIRFCAHLTRRKSGLLNHCPGGDPWQHVRTVLLDAGAVVMPDPRAH